VWPNRYEDQLVSWYNLRETNSQSDLEDCLLAVNNWWQFAPLSMHYLHWDTVTTWPDPWDLLADGIYCNLAKALGICYTLRMINRPDINDISIAETAEGDNLVLVNQGKYILNWAPNQLLNINSDKFKITKTMTDALFAKKIN
jgi:hypothetical protein